MLRSPKSTLVSVKWLKEFISSTSKAPVDANHRILDASWHLPLTGRNAATEFKEKHIPGALFFDIDACADTKTDLPHMIPTAEVFEDYVGSLGINNNTHIIVYDNNPQFPLFSAQRVWWTFRLFGHKKVSILEGGLCKWVNENGPLTKEVISPPKEKFNAKFNPNLIKYYDDIKNNIERGEYTLVDARPEGRFKGIAPEPRPDTKPGCIPQSINIPFMATMNLEEKTMKTPEELSKLFLDAGVDLKKPLAVTCGSGISACLLSLAAHMLGKDDVAVYDGSWTEWYKSAPDNLKLNVPESE